MALNEDFLISLELEISNVLRDVQRMGQQFQNFSQTANNQVGNVNSSLNGLGQQGIQTGQQVANGQQNAQNSLNQTATAGSSAGQTISESFKGVQGVIAGLIATAGGLVTSFVGIGDAIEKEFVFDKVQAQIGGTEKDIQGLEKVIRNVYENAFGDSIADVGEGVATVKTMFKDMNDTAIESFTEGAFTLRDLYGVEINETTRTVKQLTTQFKDLSEQDALDVIAKGFTDGLNYSDEFLDALQEYSPYFSEMGLDAGEMLSVMNSGFEAGAYNLDKIGDLIKEGSIRFQDLSKSSLDAFDQLGLNGKEISERFAKGGEDGAKAFQEVMEKLQGVKSESERNVLATAILGTQYEDLREQVVFSMAEGMKSSVEFSGAMEQASNSAYSNFKSNFEGIKRVSTGVLGDMFGPFLEDINKNVIPKVQEFQKAFKEGGLENALGTIISKEDAKTITDFIDNLGVSIKAFVDEYGADLSKFAKETFDVIMDGVKWMNENMDFKEIGKWTARIMKFLSVLALLPVAFIAIPVVIYKNWDKITSFFSDVFNKVKTKILDFVNVANTKFTEFKTKVSNIFSSIGNFFSNIWSSITNGFNTFVSIFVPFITTAFNNITSIPRAIFNTLVIWFSTVWESIKSIFGHALGILVAIFTGQFDKIDDIVRLLFEDLKSKFGTGLSAIKNAWDSAINWIKTVTSTVFGAIKTTISTILGTIKSVVSSAIGGIKWFFTDGLNQMWNKTKEVFGNIVEKVKTAFSDMKTESGKKVGEVKTNITTKFEEVKKWFTNLPSTFLQYGKDMINGFIDGIKSIDLGSKITKWVKSQVPDKVADLLDIHSPSRLFYYFGEMTNLGLQNGIMDGTKGLTKSVESMVSSVTAPMEDIQKIASNTINGISGNGTIGIGIDTSGLNASIKQANIQAQNTLTSKTQNQTIVQVVLDGDLKDSFATKVGTKILKQATGQMGGNLYVR